MNQNILYEYTIKETIGKGTFSKVKLGINKSTGEKVAIKILEKRKIKSKTDIIRVERELNILRKINHINLVKIIQTKEDQNNIYIIMEFINYDLFLHIVNNKRLDEKESSFYFFQLITGLEYIHSLNIVHRDLKPENLLITKKNILKIIDFGLSNYFINDELLFTPCGSPSYTPPEMIKGYKYNGFAVDIWSTGIILYGMLCGYLPFEERDNKALFKKIIKCKVTYPKLLSNNAQNLLKKILVPNPDKRIKIKDIKKHPFYLEGKDVFYKRFPDLIEKIEKNEKKENNLINNNSTPPNNYNNIAQSSKYSHSGKRQIIDYDDCKNEKDNSSSFLSKSIKKKKGPNFDLLKRILRGSKMNSSEKEINIDNTEIKKEIDNKTTIEEEHKEIEKEESNSSPIKLIRKINKEKETYKNKSQMTENRDKRNCFRQKFLNPNNDTIDFEEEKTNGIKNYIHYTNFVNLDEIEKKENKKNKNGMNSLDINNTENSSNFSQKNRNNKNNDLFIKNTNELFYKGKVDKNHNTIVNDDEKSILSLNRHLHNNNYSYNFQNIKVNHKNNYSINYNNQAPSSYFDLFYKNKSTKIKSYLTKNVKKDNNKKSEKARGSVGNRRERNVNIPKSPKYSGLSKKIISINNLYNSIQNKLDNYRESQENMNKYDNINEKNIFNSQTTLETNKNSSINENKNKNKNNIKGDNPKKKLYKNNNYKNINDNKYKKNPKLLKSSNNNSYIDMRKLKNDSSKKIYIDTVNNNDKSMSQKFKIIKNKVKRDIIKKPRIENDKYNIQEIIKKRGLGKHTNK